LAKYGIDYYGTAYYGSNTLVDFSAAPFIAKPVDYQDILLTWTAPTGDWDYLRLIRSAYGFPITADDGDVLFEDENATTRVSYVDTGAVPNNIGLKEGKPYYYSIFVRETTFSSWKPAGNAIGISIKNYNTLKNMYNSLPTILTSQVPYDASVERTNDVLERFLKLFALNLDLYKSQTENIINRYNIIDLNGALIPVFMREFGLRYEPELGLKQSKILLNNAVRLYKNKGSKQGIEEYVKAYAGYDNVISMGKNLMLDQNDSSFEQSIGSWTPDSSCLLSRHLTTSSPTIAPYNEVTAQSNFPNLQSATLKVTSVAGGALEFYLSGDTPIHYGIPVTAGSAYTFSVYSKAGTTIRGVRAQLYWYSKTGALISAATIGSSVNNSTSTWTRVSTTATAPATAYFCVPHIKIAGTSTSETHYFDAAQFELGSSATNFQDARQIEINLIATRINEILNPNFEDSTDNWTVTNATTILNIAASVPDSGSVVVSEGAMEIYASAAGLVTLTSNAMGILSNNDYTFSIYCSAKYPVGGTNTKAVVPYIKWYDSSSVLISTATGDSITATNSFVRAYITSKAPEDAVTATVGITWTATAAGDELTGNEISVDAALFEKSSFLNSYFDGSNGVASLTDLFWEGNTPNDGRSHYYKNRFSVQSRLVSTIPNWINLGSTFELFFAQPD